MKNLIKTILLIGSIILAITGCTNNPPLKSNPTLPKVTNVKVIKDRTAIALQWDMVDKPNIKGYYIQRSANDKKYIQIAKIDSKYITHFTDTNLKPNKKYYYKLATYTNKGIPSTAIKISTTTADTIEPIIWFVDAHIKVKGKIKMLFRPSINERVKGYIIERYNDKNSKWEQITKLEPRLRFEYIDSGLLDGKVYQYRIIAYTWDGLKSKPKTLSAKTLQLPKIVQNITATTNKVKEIDVSWQKVPQAQAYKIYYSDDGDDFVLLKKVSGNITKYIDIINQDGINRFYKITVVDKNGLESLKSQKVMGSTLDIPIKPMVSFEKERDGIKFTLNSPDGRAVRYIIKREPNKKIIKQVQPDGYTEVIDKLTPTKGVVHNYKIYIQDKNGLISKPTELEVIF